ncbi:TolB family protein [Aquimonas voraii]|uniref:WD40-like Beta Propeller Repeat n=1 Tax=Aquimonas voraii TaxID=265719 RepID=A0A1G6WN44_9GAMM|nr:PD40 domain-containing protein [Aquimonas voraii]SDD67231.1 WD40-like Beta Propeller Repeat [Aquimonas voraii]
MSMFRKPSQHLLLSLMLAAGAPLAFAGDLGLFRITGSSGNQANGDVQHPAVHDGALLVAYSTSARNLGLDHQTGAAQIYVQDAVTDALELISAAPNGLGSNGNAVHPAFSGNARFVAFSSFASNILGIDQPQFLTLYLRDRVSQTTRRVSNGLNGLINGQARYPTVSDDGRYVAYYSQASNQLPNDTNGQSDLLLTDMNTGTTERLSLSNAGGQVAEGAQESWMPSLSGDARYAVFSARGNLTSIPDNTAFQIHLRDRQAQTTALLSLNAQGQAGNSSSDQPSLSRNGRYVAFRSFATNLVGGAHSGLFRLDRSSGQLLALPTPPNSFACSLPTVSNRGDVSFLCSDSPGSGRQVWLFRAPSSLFLLSGSTAGGVSNGVAESWHAMGENGVLMAYASNASTIVSGDTNALTDTFVVADVGRLGQLFSDGFE